MKLISTKPRLVIDVGQVWVAAMTANVLLYLFQLMVGRNMAPEEYGLFGALFGLVFLAAALSNGIQVSIAKFVSETLVARNTVAIGLLTGTAMIQVVVLAVVGFAIFAAFSPLIGSYLRTDSLTPVFLNGGVVAVSLALPVVRGVFQGSQRFPVFSLTQLLAAGTRLALGAGALMLNLGLNDLLLAAGLSSLLAAAIGMAFIRAPVRISFASLPVSTMIKILVPTTIGALAINLQTSADVVIVRNLFSASESGLYAGVSVLGRAVIFLPMSVSIVLFPKFASEMALLIKGRRAGTFVLSGVTCALLVVFPKLALTSFLGGGYADGASLVPLYAAAMFLFSLSVVFLYYHLAAERRAYLYLLLLPHLAAELGLIYVFHQSLTQVVLVLLFVNLSLVTVSAVYTRVANSYGSADPRLAVVSQESPSLDYGGKSCC